MYGQRSLLWVLSFNSCPAVQKGVSRQGGSKMGTGVMGRGQSWTRDSCHHSGKAHREGRTKSDNALDVPASRLLGDSPWALYGPPANGYLGAPGHQNGALGSARGVTESAGSHALQGAEGAGPPKMRPLPSQLTMKGDLNLCPIITDTFP